MIARFLFLRKLPTKFLQFFVRCDQEPLGMQHTLLVFQERFKKKKAGLRGERKKIKKKRKGEGGKDGNRAQREEANRDGSSL